MAELRARHPTSPPENNPSQNYNHQFNHHSSQGYSNYSNFNQAEANQSPFGQQVFFCLKIYEKESNLVFLE